MALWYRRKRPPSGLWPTCSYDLRAHALGQACPECGTPVSSSSSCRPGIQ
jgi:hypothetical protein